MGVTIGREPWGGQYLEQIKVFFGLHESRLFMRCLQAYANCLYSLGKEEESIAIMEEIIELNPKDNQDIRDVLMLYLIDLN